MPKRVDANQKEIMDKLREMPGVSAHSTHTVGDGFTDIIVGCEKSVECPHCNLSSGIPFNYIFELKNPEQPPSKRKLREKQKKFRDEWTGQVDTALCLYDIIEIIKKNGEKP